jgi:hypothetical protein
MGERRVWRCAGSDSGVYVLVRTGPARAALAKTSGKAAIAARANSARIPVFIAITSPKIGFNLYSRMA